MIRNGILHPREFTAAKSTVAGLGVLSPGLPSQAHSPGIPPSVWKMGLFLPAWPSGAKGTNRVRSMKGLCTVGCMHKLTVLTVALRQDYFKETWPLSFEALVIREAFIEHLLCAGTIPVAVTGLLVQWGPDTQRRRVWCLPMSLESPKYWHRNQPDGPRKSGHPRAGLCWLSRRLLVVGRCARQRKVRFRSWSMGDGPARSS